MMPKEKPALGKKVEGDFPEQNLGVGKLIETLIKGFIKSDSSYGMITDIKTDISLIYKSIKDYISRERLDIYALKFDDKIFLSRTNLGFEDIYEVVKKYSTLQVKKALIEVWDDEENGILHFIIIPLRKHFPVEYSNEKEKIRAIKIFLNESIP